MREREKYNKWCWQLDADCTSLYFLYCWVIPVGVHLSDRFTIAALSQCVMFSNRFVKWMAAGDGTYNDALCLLLHQCATLLYNVCVCESNPNGYWWSFALPLYQHSHLWACMLMGCVCFLLFKCYVSQHFVKCMFLFAGENLKIFRILKKSGVQGAQVVAV